MERTVLNGNLHTIHFKARQRSGLHSFPESFLYGRYIFLGYVTSFDLVLELKSHFTLFRWLHCKYDIRKFTTATGLFLVYLTMVGPGRNCLLIFHLWLTLVDIDLKFTSESVYDNIQMELAHPGDYGLSGSLIGLDLESRILFGQFGQGHP